MSTINDLSVTSTVSSADQIPMWQTANGVTRRLPVSVLDGRYITQDQINLLQISPTPEIFSSGDGIVPNTFVPGTTFSLILANLYGAGNNIDVFFDGTFQGSDQWSLTAYSLIFKSPIPVGTSKVYVKGGAARITNGVSNGSITDVSVSTSSKLYNRITDWVDVKDFGAKGDGVTNDTVAVTAAMNSIATGGSLIFPTGNYLCDPMVFSNFNGAKVFGFGGKITLNSSGTLMTFHNAQFCRLSGITFQASGAAQSLANGLGVLFDQASGNNQIDNSNFFGFALDGLAIKGANLANGLSGHKVLDNFFLGNGRYQLSMQFSNDFHIEKNQYGMFAGITHAQKGCYLQNCSAGTYAENYHWSNGVGLHAVGCNYNSYINNRIEMSDQQNVILDTDNYGMFEGNKPHTASMSVAGSFDSVQLINGCANMIITGNNLFTFSPGVTFGRYGINVDAGCTNITLGKNRVGTGSYAAGFGPYRLDGGSLNDATVNCDFDLSACSQTTIGPSSTVYMGSAGTNTVEKATHWVVPRQCQAMRLSVFADTAPGVGQTFTYILRVNGVATVMQTTISGTAFQGDAPTTAPAVLLSSGSFVTVQLVTSAGAASAFHRSSMSFSEY